MKKSKLLYDSNDWTSDRIKKTYDACAEIAEKELKQEWYPLQFEIIGSEQMLDAYSSVGMPVMYNHWSFGKHFLRDYTNYSSGSIGLAYEIIINSNPCIAYLMEENSMLMQNLVIAHVIGHSNFFAKNYLFKKWTDADAIVDYLDFARNYIRECEIKHGIEKVESLLDSCHSLMNYGIDKYKRPKKLNAQAEKERMQQRAEQAQISLNDFWEKTTNYKKTNKTEFLEIDPFPKEPQENILYFIEKHSPILEPWQREIVRIVRKISQYFYPQRQTKVSNEGWASFTHFYIMQRLYDLGKISEGNMIEFLKYHSAVLYQPGFNSKRYSGINPYKLGFEIYMDIKRICEQPNQEDKLWFDWAGSNWVETCQWAMQNFRDESFISQFMSPAVIRKMRLFSLEDKTDSEFLKITNIHNDNGYKKVRNACAKSYDISITDPNIQIVSVDLKGDRTLYLTHWVYDDVPLSQNQTKATLKHLQKLWGYPVCLHSKNAANNYLEKVIQVDN